MLKLRRLSFLLFSVVAVSVAVIILVMDVAKADTGSLWLAPSNLSLQKQADLASVPISINGNIDCFAQANGICGVSTGYGLADTSGAVRLSNTPSPLPVYSFVDNHQHFVPIPNSNTAISYSTEPPIGFYLYFNYNFSGIIKKLNNGLGDYYQINRPPDGQLADKSFHRLAADYTSISFSENGRWMIVSAPNLAMLRVDLESFEVLPFGPGFDYTIGLDPAPKTAITNDGRYAVVASKDFNKFSFYDLNTCGATPLAITGPINCQSRDLQGFMQQQVGGYTSVSNLRFVSNDALSLYASYTKDGQPKITKYILSPSGSIIHQQDYLALGDSYISGEGAFDYLPGTDTSDNQCHVSAVSYPLLAGKELNYNAYHSVACSGATTNDLIDTNDKYPGQLKNKISRQNLNTNNQVPSILSNFQQGYIDQLDFVSQYQPKIVTVSVGGNDIGFSAKLQSCLGIGTCYGTYEDRLEFVNELTSKLPTIVSAYSKIKSAGAADARIYVVGYPQIAKVGGNCALNVHMNNDELVFAQQAIDYLDAVIQTAAARAGVFYINTQDALAGHRLCEAEPGSVAVNGITAGNDFPARLNGPIGRESYHPNAFGYQLLESAILASTSNLTSPMPAPNPSKPLPTQTSLDILNAPHSGRAVISTEYEQALIDDSIYKQVPTDVNIDGSGHSLAASSSLQAELHSNPTSLGSFTTDLIGNLTAQITIPASVPAGYHSLHFFGTDISGQPVDIYKTIYVAATADDLDGNGILDAAQKCVGVDASGQDSDQDGIDDSCDASLTLPPAQTTQSAQVSGELSSQTDGLEIVASGQTDKPTDPDSPSNVSFAERAQADNHAVLDAHTFVKTINPKNTESNIRLSNKYFAPTGLGIFLISSLAYFAKNWLG